MEKEEVFYNKVVEKLCNENKDVSAGKMMSSPGVKWKSKVFAFYYNKKMVFRLEKGFEPESLGITNYNFLSPFKNKPPMKGWFIISFYDKSKWTKLAKEALKIISTPKKGK